MKFYIEILGCPMRATEAQRLCDYFIANGFRESSIEDADLVAVFTCSVVDETEATTVAFVDRITNSNKRVLLLGCSPGISPEMLENRYGFEMIATKDLEIKIDSLFPEFAIKFESISLPSKLNTEYKYGIHYLSQFDRYNKSSLFVKQKPPALLISSKGCNNNCSYCTMRRALGPVKSYSLEMIGENYRKIREAGTKVIVFNADDTGAYGIDQQKTFSVLLDYCYEIEMDLKKGKVQWIIDNLHPMWAIRYQEAFVKYIKNKTIVEITMPLQAASDKLLKLMKRKYRIEEVEQCVISFKKANEKLFLRTHFIIGFPTETQQDIEQLETILKKKYFDHVILLKYYEGENSDSAILADKVANSVVDQRVSSLSELLKQERIEFYVAGTMY